jgi:hypothetical protein
MRQGDDRAGVLNWAMLQAVLAERPGIRLPRSVAGAARGAASSRGSWDHPGLHRQQALALHFLARELISKAVRCGGRCVGTLAIRWPY